MSRSKRKRFEKKSVATRNYEAKQKELDLDKKQPVEPKKPSPGDQVVLSKAEFAKHKAARDLMLASIGTVSQQLHRGITSEADATAKLISSAKRAIQKTNIRIALRAWDECYHRAMRMGSITVDKEVIPLFWEPLALFWRQYGFKGQTLTELLANAEHKKTLDKPETNKVKLLCEVCMKDKAVKEVSTPKGDKQLCQYCRAKVTKGVEL